MTKQVKFNLDEEEEIHFKLSIKGSSNLPKVRPVMRFIISENTENGNVAVVLPARPTDEGVVVNIPPLKEFFTEEKEYIGKLEIIVGNRYFSPTAMSIGFTKAVDIKAEPILKEHTQGYHVDGIETSGKVSNEEHVDFHVRKKTQPIKESKEEEYDPIDDIPDEVLAALEIDTPKVTPKKPVAQKPVTQKESLKETPKKLEKNSFDDLPDEVFASLEKELSPVKKQKIKSFPKPVIEQKKPIIIPAPKKSTKKEPVYKAEVMNLLRDALKEK